MRQVRDEVDALAVEWARVRRELLGLADPRKAREFLGAPRCTLSNVREHGDGAGSRTSAKQYFPEVHTPAGLRFARAFTYLPPDYRRVIDVHYCIALPAETKCGFMGLSRRCYYARLEGAKNAIRGALAVLEAGPERVHAAA